MSHRAPSRTFCLEPLSQAKVITAFTGVLGFSPEHHASGGACTRTPGCANHICPCSRPWSEKPHAGTSVKPGNAMLLAGDRSGRSVMGGAAEA